MSRLDLVIPTPALAEIDAIDLEERPVRVWELVRHGDLAASPLVRALLAGALRERSSSHAPTLRIDDLVSSLKRPGFQTLTEDRGHEVVVGAIAKIWHLAIPFVHVAGRDAFRGFADPGFVKIAWALRVTPRGEHKTHLELELRVDATDREAWSKFRRYFALIGPATRLVRRSFLSSFGRGDGELSSPEEKRPLPGDELLEGPVVQVTHGVTIAASPDEVWPWLLETALGRGGLVTIDVPPRVGDLLPPTPDFDDGLEVLALEPRRTLVLGSLYDADARRPRRFSAERPDTFWRSTWSFVLEAHEGRSTRLYVRARATFGGARRLQAEWIRPVHHLMDAAQLHHLKRCAEGAAAPAIGGGRVDDAAMVAAFVTPAKEGHVHWGVDRETADRVLPGDELVQAPSWCWTHGIEIAGSASEVWSWLARLGEADNGFYSYQWLEGPVGAGVGESPVASPGPGSLGDPFVIHPRIPPLTIAGVEKGHFLLLRAGRDGRDSADGERWATLSWLFLVEGLDDGRSRLISRYRGAMSDDLKTRLNFGPALLEPVGFAMDRRVLLGVKARVESRRRSRRRPNEAPATKRARA